MLIPNWEYLRRSQRYFVFYDSAVPSIPLGCLRLKLSGKVKSVTFGKAQCTRAWETQIKIDTSSVTKLFGYKFAWYKENH